MMVACQECSASISDAAISCPRCGAPPDVYLGARHNCSECGADYRPAYPECRSCGAPRDVAMDASANNSAAQPLPSEAGRPTSNSTPEAASIAAYRDPTLGNIFSFEGRTGRSGYFLINLVTIPIAIICAAVLRDGGIGEPVFTILLGLVVVVCLWVILATGARRCHDAGWSGWWVLLALLPLISLVFGVVMLFVPSALAKHHAESKALGEVVRSS